MKKSLFQLLPLGAVLVAFTVGLSMPAAALDEVFQNSIGMTFVKIPAGTFMMGSPLDEFYRDGDETQHKVTIEQPFYMQTTEVTVAQWKALMGEKLFVHLKGDETVMPITGVSWKDALQFIEKLNALDEGAYRLPTEAEWEYAARAGSDTPYHSGNVLDCARAMHANSAAGASDCMAYNRSRGLFINHPAPVQSYPPNGWGLYGMHGNVWEWCLDWYGLYPQEPVAGPQGPETGVYRVRRGGSWFGADFRTRSANRDYGLAGSKYRTTGFRVVLQER